MQICMVCPVQYFILVLILFSYQGLTVQPIMNGECTSLEIYIPRSKSLFLSGIRNKSGYTLQINQCFRLNC